MNDQQLPLTNYRQSPSIAALAAALAKAQGVLEGARKDTEGQVGTAKKKYADLASVWAACKAALAANGLAVVQVPAATADAAGVDTLLCHGSGEWVAGTLLLPVARRDAQGMGSAITYARRYALMAFVGVAPEDDDGDAAVGPPGPHKARRAAAPVGNEALVRALCAKAAALRAAKNLTGVLGLAITGAGFTLAAGREVPRSTDAALALFADWAESDLRQIDRWLDGQLQDAPGPAGAGRAGLVRQIDAEIRKRRGATWIGLLRYYEVRGADGQPLPFTWPEPGTPDEAAAEVGRLPVTEETLRRMLGEFAPKGKPAPGAQPQPAA